MELEITSLIQENPGKRIFLSNLHAEFLKKYNKKLLVTDYGFSYMSDFLKALSGTLKVSQLISKVYAV